MAKAFKKSTLHVGTYHSPDGEVVVTPARLSHWAGEHQRLTDANQVVPMHWDHSGNPDELKPIAMDAFDRKDRTAENSVGKLTGFTLAEDGQSADIEFVTLTPSATEKVESNAVYVSPVIFPAWKDGAGNQYSDVITHMDLVDHPVDHSQGPAVPIEKPIACAIRMGLSPKPFRMSQELPMADADKTADNSTPGDGTQPSVKEVLDSLGEFGLKLPGDTTEANFFDRVRTAAIAGTDDPSISGADITAADPQIMTMSLQARQALAFGEQQHRKSVMGELDHLLQSGRCTPAEYDDHKQSVGIMKLSLDDKGNPSQGAAEHWIKSRQPVPEGTFWSNDEKLKRMSAMPAEQPGPTSFGGEMSQADEDAQVERMTARLGK